jgi:RimJ/RimL family protein N-acetyltransferase
VGELTFRAVAADDGPSLLVVLADPEVACWLREAGRTDPFSPSECAGTAATGAAHWLAHGLGPWIVLDSREVVAHGGLGFKLVDGRAELELAWAVARHRWGEGIATAIGREAIELAAAHGAREVTALARVDNRASVKVMQKLGMTLERELEHAGHPHVLYRRTSLDGAARGAEPGDASWWRAGSATQR